MPNAYGANSPTLIEPDSRLLDLIEQAVHDALFDGWDEDDIEAAVRAGKGRVSRCDPTK
jgi:hypothetical protein